jgi:hypothetical protein
MSATRRDVMWMTLGIIAVVLLFVFVAMPAWRFVRPTFLTISGRVTDEFGKPIAGVGIEVLPGPGEPIQTGVDGSYEWDGLVLGVEEYDVTCGDYLVDEWKMETRKVKAGSRNVDFVLQPRKCGDR